GAARISGTRNENYQRGSRRGRPKPPPPLRLPPAGRPPPAPPPSPLGLASLTFIGRPPRFAPLRALIALSASASFGISTNANPRDLPVSRSVMILTRSTAPYASNNWRTESSVAPKLRLPTKMFFTRSPWRFESGQVGAELREGHRRSLGTIGQNALGQSNP